MRLVAAAADLPPAVAAALAQPGPGTPGTVDVDGTRWPTIAWGRETDPPVVLVHGVTSNAGIWWRIGPAIAATGRHVVAVDMPGHGIAAGSRRGPTGPRGAVPVARSHRFLDTATDLAACIRAAGLDRADLVVVGHSWGGMVTAHLPVAGLTPATLVLVDPPALTVKQLRAYSLDPTERAYTTPEEAAAAVRATNPTWTDRDIEAKALALTEFNGQFVLDILLRNGDFDAGLAALRDPAAVQTDVWLIRGEWKSGGLIPDSHVRRIERQLGADHVIAIAGGPHSPQRTHPEATMLAILRALGT